MTSFVSRLIQTRQLRLGFSTDCYTDKHSVRYFILCLLYACHADRSNPSNTANLSSLLVPRMLAFTPNTKPAPSLRSSGGKKMNDGKKSRRRRSSSLIYQEPPESIEHMSDQSALPNVNADWVNAKGEHASSSGFFREDHRRQHWILWPDSHSPPSSRSFLSTLLTLLSPSRSLGHPRHMHHWSQAPLRRHSRSLPRNIMDTCQYRLHVQLILDVSLRPRCPL